MGTDDKEKKGSHREPVLALRFQIPSQASLRGIVKSHRPLAPRAALRRRFAPMMRELGALGRISLLIQRRFWKTSRKLACRWISKNSNPFAKRITPSLPRGILHPCISVPFDSVAPAPSPYGPTFGCSTSHLPRCSVVVKENASSLATSHLIFASFSSF